MKKNKVFAAGLVIVMMALAPAVSCKTDDDGGGDNTVYEDFDMVVVGTGIAGYSATIAAKVAKPALKLVLIEKNSYVGGITRTAGGGFGAHIINAADQDETTFTAAYQLQMKGNTADTTSVNYIDSVVTQYPNYPKLYAIAKQARDAQTFLRANGLPASGNGGVLVNGNAAADPAVHGLDKYVTETLGVDRRLNCTALDLVTGGGKVTGVVVNDSGVRKTLRAKKVLLATGGFHQSPEMVAQYAGNVPGLNGVVSDAAASNSTGDGITMAVKIGADVYKSSFSEIWNQICSANLEDLPTYGANFYAPSFVGFGSSVLRYNQMVVDGDGIRWRREDGFFGFAAAGSYYMIKRNKYPYWAIYSSDNATEIIGGASGFNLVDALEAAATSSQAKHKAEVKKGNTLEALAAEMGLTGQKATDFVAAVNAYDGYVTAALADPSAATPDPLGKATTALDKPLSQGPFYAVKFYPCTFDSEGGVVSDEFGRVLKTEGDPNSIIPNLYAIGAVSNRDLYQETYVGGTSIAMYSTIGRIAGKHAADNLND